MLIWLLTITVTFPVLVPSAQGLWEFREPQTITYVRSIHPTERECKAMAATEVMVAQTSVSSIECKSQRIGEIKSLTLSEALLQFLRLK